MTQQTDQAEPTAPTPRRYFYVPPAHDRRRVEQRVCDTCGQAFAVRVPSVGQDWTTCVACQTKADLAAIEQMERYP